MDKRFFSTPLQTRQTQSNAQLESYIEYHEALIKDSIQQAEDMGPNFRPIIAYFPPHDPPTLPLPPRQLAPIPEHIRLIII